jgi:type II secretory pathway component PulF
MPLYRWQGVDKAGTSHKGLINAASRQQAQIMLAANNSMAILVLKEAWLEGFFQSFLNSRQPSSYQLHLFFAQLCAFVQAGISLTQALNTTLALQQNRRLRSDIQSVIVQLQQGQSFAKSLETIEYLPPYALDLITAGQATGNLEHALASIAEMMLAEHTYQTTLRNAASGPLITLAVAIIITIGTISFLMPQFGKLYQQAQLPTPLIIAWSLALKNFLHAKMCLFIAVGAGILIFIFKKTLQRVSFIHLAARLPLIKNSIINADIFRWISIMHAYTSSGLPLLDGCYAAQQQAVSQQFKKLIAACCIAITEGATLSSSLASSSLPAILFIRPLILAGEETGDLTPMLSKAKLELAELMQQQTTLLTGLIGPIMTISIGLIIGTLLVVLYMPIMQLGSLVR